MSTNKGKTWEEIYGPEKAALMKIAQAERCHRYKGRVSHNKGNKMSEEQKSKISKSVHSWYLRKWGNSPSEKKLIYRPFVPIIRYARECFKYRQWRSDVFTRDDYICANCGVRGGKLEAHHHERFFSEMFVNNNIKTIDEVLDCEELWDINNGMTLCVECHKLVHFKQGRKSGGV